MLYNYQLCYDWSHAVPWSFFDTDLSKWNKKTALKRVHSHQSLSTHYWLAGIWHQISIVLIHYVKSVIRIYMYLLQHTKQMLMFFATLEERYSISIRKRESIEKNCCPFCFFLVHWSPQRTLVPSFFLSSISPFCMMPIYV